MSLEYDPIFLDREVCHALQAWPEIPDEAVYAKLHAAAIIGTRPQDVDKTKGPFLTRLGDAFVKWVQTRSFSTCETTETFFTLERVLQCWPLEMLSDRLPAIHSFLDLFGIDFNTPDVRRYISKNMGTNVRQSHGFWQNPVEATRLHVTPSLLECFDLLGDALIENTYPRRVDTWKYKLDDDIPF